MEEPVENCSNDVQSDDAQHTPKKKRTEFKQRVNHYLYDNLNRVLCELYFYCEHESNAIQCSEVLNILSHASLKFHQLNRQLIMLSKANLKDTKSISWNVSSLSPQKVKPLLLDAHDENKDSSNHDDADSAGDAASRTKQRAKTAPRCWADIDSDSDLDLDSIDAQTVRTNEENADGGSEHGYEQFIKCDIAKSTPKSEPQHELESTSVATELATVEASKDETQCERKEESMIMEDDTQCGSAGALTEIDINAAVMNTSSVAEASEAIPDTVQVSQAERKEESEKEPCESSNVIYAALDSNGREQKWRKKQAAAMQEQNEENEEESAETQTHVAKQPVISLPQPQPQPSSSGQVLKHQAEMHNDQENQECREPKTTLSLSEIMNDESQKLLHKYDTIQRERQMQAKMYAAANQSSELLPKKNTAFPLAFNEMVKKNNLYIEKPKHECFNTFIHTANPYGSNKKIQQLISKLSSNNNRTMNPNEQLQKTQLKQQKAEKRRLQLREQRNNKWQVVADKKKQKREELRRQTEFQLAQQRNELNAKLNSAKLRYEKKMKEKKRRAVEYDIKIKNAAKETETALARKREIQRLEHEQRMKSAMDRHKENINKRQENITLHYQEKKQNQSQQIAESEILKQKKEKLFQKLQESEQRRKEILKQIIQKSSEHDDKTQHVLQRKKQIESKKFTSHTQPSQTTTPTTATAVAAAAVKEPSQQRHHRHHHKARHHKKKSHRKQTSTLTPTPSPSPAPAATPTAISQQQQQSQQQPTKPTALSAKETNSASSDISFMSIGSEEECIDEHGMKQTLRKLLASSEEYMDALKSKRVWLSNCPYSELKSSIHSLGTKSRKCLAQLRGPDHDKADVQSVLIAMIAHDVHTPRSDADNMSTTSASTPTSNSASTTPTTNAAVHNHINGGHWGGMEVNIETQLQNVLKMMDGNDHFLCNASSTYLLMYLVSDIVELLPYFNRLSLRSQRLLLQCIVNATQKNRGVAHYIIRSNSCLYLLHLLLYQISDAQQIQHSSEMDAIIHTLTIAINSIRDFPDLVLRKIMFYKYLNILRFFHKLRALFDRMVHRCTSTIPLHKNYHFFVRIVPFIQSVTSFNECGGDQYKQIQSQAEYSVIFDVIKETNFYGLQSLISALVLNENENNKYYSWKKKKAVLNLRIVFYSFQSINNIARINLAAFQHIINEMKIELYHVLSYLLSYLTLHIQQSPPLMSTAPSASELADLINNEHYINRVLLNQVLLFISYCCLSNCPFQQCLRYGDAKNNLIHKLCQLPFDYFIKEQSKKILFPTMIACTYQNEENLKVMNTVLNKKHLILFITKQCHAKHKQSQTQTTQSQMNVRSSKDADNNHNIAYELEQRFPVNLWRSALHFYKQY